MRNQFDVRISVNVMAQEKRIPSLDGLRAISIVLVLASHWCHSPSFPHWGGWLGNWGKTGVFVFFVLSGYLITLLLLDEESRHGRISLKEFYIRRVFRILPAYWTYLVTIAVLTVVGVVSVTPRSFVSAVTFTTNIIPAQVSWELAHTWTLALEEVFYLCWPLTMILTRRNRRIAIAIGCIVVMPMLRAGLGWFAGANAVFEARLLMVDTMMYGALAAIGVRSWPGQVQHAMAKAPGVLRCIALAVLVVGGFCYSKRFVPMVSGSLGISLLGIATIYLTLSLTQIRSGVLYTLCNWRPVVEIGLWSYSLYLWQQLFLVPSGHGLESSWRESPFNLALAIICAVASYYCVEQPILRLRKKVFPAKSVNLGLQRTIVASS